MTEWYAAVLRLKNDIGQWINKHSKHVVVSTRLSERRSSNNWILWLLHCTNEVVEAAAMLTMGLTAAPLLPKIQDLLLLAGGISTVDCAGLPCGQPELRAPG
jgi:TusA-related sulfurtransferase